MNGDKGQGRLERRVAALEEKERSNRTIVAALRRIETNLGYIGDVIRQSKGDMTADEEKEVGTALDDLNKTAGQKPQEPVPANNVTKR